MVTLPKQVLKRWRQIYDDPDSGPDMVIELLLHSRLDPVQATDAMTRSLARAVAAFEAAHTEPLPDAAGALPYPGEWHVTPVPEGALLIGGRKSDDRAGELLETIAADLSAQGIKGKLGLYKLPELPSTRASVSYFEATIRVVGQRTSRRSWVVDREALERVLRAGVDWCLEARPDRGITVQSGANPTMIVRRCDSPRRRALEVLYREFWTTLRSIGEDRYRSVTAMPLEGRVTVFEAGPCVHHRGWRPTIAALKQFLSLTHADAVYGRVRRAEDPHDAQHPYSAAYEHDRLAHTGANPLAYEDHLARDAYPIQLLGPGYTRPLPTAEEWIATQLGDGHTLLEHSDPAAWFDEITLADAIHRRPLPRTELVERARATLAPILYPRIHWTELKPFDDEPAQPPVVLPQSIVTQIQTLPHPAEDDPRHVALVMSDSRILEDVELSPSGAIVIRIAGNKRFTLNPGQVTDVLERVS
jgi:hypothetical protein